MFLLGLHFPLRNEQKTLGAIFTSAKSVSSRVTTWLVALHPFDFAIDVIASKENVVSDSLSHKPVHLRLQSPDTSDDFGERLDQESSSASEVGSEPSIALLAIDPVKLLNRRKQIVQS